MLTAIQVQAQIDAIDASRGVLEVHHADGRIVRYASEAEKRLARADLVDLLATINGNPTPLASYATHTRCGQDNGPYDPSEWDTNVGHD